MNDKTQADEALDVAEPAMLAHWAAATATSTLIASTYDSVYEATREALRRALSLVLGSIAEADEFYDWMLDSYGGEKVAWFLDEWRRKRATQDWNPVHRWQDSDTVR